MMMTLKRETTRCPGTHLTFVITISCSPFPYAYKRSGLFGISSAVVTIVTIVGWW